MPRPCQNDVATALPPDHEADSLGMRRRLPGQRRGEAGTSGGDLDLHVDLPSLNRQGQPLCRSVFQALPDLPGDQLRRLGDRRQAVRAANFETQEDGLTNVEEGGREVLPL